MYSVSELYTLIYDQLNGINRRIENAERQLLTAEENNSEVIALRIDKLKKQLIKVEEYSEKVTYFRRLAEKHITSKNLLTITPRELNFNRMRNWAMMIDPTEKDDPYAQRIYVQAMCNSMFLENKRKSFEAEMRELQAKDANKNADLEKSVKALKEQLAAECQSVLESEHMTMLCEQLTQKHKKYSDASQLQQSYGDAAEDDIGIGVYALPFPVMKNLQYLAKAKLGDYYVNGSGILFPVEISSTKENVISVICAASKEKRLYKGIQNYILNTLSALPVGAEQIHVIDAIHYNNAVLGGLKPIENTIAIESIPKDPEAVLDRLRLIVSSFTDIDEKLGVADTVAEHNSTATKDQLIQRKLLILVGYPTAFSSEAKELIKRILLNNDRYGISVVLADTQLSSSKEDQKAALPIDIAEGLTRIMVSRQNATVSKGDNDERHFRWYELNEPLTDEFIERIRSLTVNADILGTEYPKRIDMVNVPPYTRGKKSIDLPYGVDSKDQVNNICFDNENFSAYLMGASGSGKSTLLHTLITGIIRNYHPDDVELWLADFKMSEFAQYIDPLPPHVKYILLDESHELVYDLIDRLTDKMMERQRFFMKNREMKKVENVPSNIYMPVIFVILDEFSIMSQAIAESQTYKLRLQNLLAKGRALGIKFLFSSQTFLSGIAGLTTTAKAQIQSRIAMKNSKEEITETLELSSAQKTDQVKNWIDTLPPHYALFKYRDGDSLQIKRLQVMYFKGKAEEALAPQRNLINRLNQTLRSVSESEYSPDRLDCYVDKHPVIVDGNSYSAFDHNLLNTRFRQHREAMKNDLSPDDVLMAFGSPRRMFDVKIATVSSETRENILLLARAAEQACGAAVIMSAIESFVLQGKEVEIWAYSKNRIFHTYKSNLWNRFTVIEGIDAVCDRIYELRQNIQETKAESKLIVLLGMERICMDFEFSDSGSQVSPAKQGPSISEIRESFVKKGAVPQSDREMQELEYGVAWNKRRMVLVSEARAAGKTRSEISAYTREQEAIFHKEYFGEADNDAALPAAPVSGAGSTAEAASETTPQNSSPEEEPAPAPHAPGAYNAAEDFVYVIKQGSRFGLHFMLCLSSCSDIKQCGLKPDFFRHRLAFQLSVDDSRNIFSSKVASELPEHICQYDDSLDRYSFRPYLHRGLGWEGWFVDNDGTLISPYTDSES